MKHAKTKQCVMQWSTTLRRSCMNNLKSVYIIPSCVILCITGKSSGFILTFPCATLDETSRWTAIWLINGSNLADH